MLKELISAAFSLTFLSVNAQMMREDISLSDPFILADPISKAYYMTGTAGDLFKSTDLELWTVLPWGLKTNDIDWVGVNHTSPSPAQIWAPELYYKNGAYYNVVTFTNPNATTEGTSHPRRSIHILKSDKPEGPYQKIPGSDNLYLPANKMALDGNIWEEDGRLYLVYCYEWVQAGDGAIEYIELKPDLTGTIGESHHICKASDGRAWNTDAVTDGCFIFRTQTGRLGMIWTGWRSGNYVQGVSYSDNGKLDGNWSHEKCPITPDNYGHGMMFRNFDGQLLMSIHSHRNIDYINQNFERHPVLFVMDDSGDNLRAVMQYRHKYSVTSPAMVVVPNAGFDYSTTAWTCTTLAFNCKIASNQNGAITGNYYESWDEHSFTGEIYQELDLPNGTYRFTAAAFRSALISGATEDNKAVCLFANDEVCDITSATPQDYTVTVHVANGKLRFGIRSNKKNYQWMGIDNAHIMYYGEENVSTESIDDGQAIYLRNKQTGMFLNTGQSWGTQAILSPHAMDLYLRELPDGKFVIDTRIDNGGGKHYAGANGYMDSEPAIFTIDMTEPNTCTLSTGYRQYWGAPTGDVAVQTGLTTASSDAAQWEIKKRSDLIAGFEDATAENPADATFLVQGGNFGRNDTRVAAYWNGSYEWGGDVKNQCVQASSGAFNINQTLTNIPNGVYELHVQGFYRHGTASTAADNRENGKEMLNAYLYANKEQIPLMSVFEHAGHHSIPNDHADHTSMGTIPSTLEGASAMFSAGLYKHKLYVEVTDGKLTVGVKKSVTTHSETWTVFDNFELYYIGTEMPSTVNSPQKVTQTESTDIFDLQGRKIPSYSHLMQRKRKGIYIVNGKKVLLP